MNNIFILPSTKILEAMKILTLAGSQCLIVADKKKYFYGTLNDGDLRRGILKGLSGKDTIQSLYQKKSIFIFEEEFSMSFARSLMRKHRLPVLPILNKKKLISNYLTWNKAFGIKKDNSLKNVDFIIMAGGKGARLSPFTKVLPKPLLPIDEKTVIEHIIEKFTNRGGKNFNITVNYKSLLLKSYFKELKPNYKIRFFEEKKPMGTVGGLSLHRKKFKKNDIFLCNCDVIIDADLSEIYKFHIDKKNDFTIVASTKSYEIPYGICHINKSGKLIKIEEKPKSKFFVNTGLYIFKPKILDLIPKNSFFHMTELIELAKRKKFKVGICPITDNDWVDIGQLSNYSKLIKL
jgi:dTDP-glucose pyrophosphorylase